MDLLGSSVRLGVAQPDCEIGQSAARLKFLFRHAAFWSFEALAVGVDQRCIVEGWKQAVVDVHRLE